MKVITKSLELNRFEYYKKHLLIINHLLPIQMTEKEAEVIAGFLSLEGDLAKNPFSPSSRKIVREIVGIKSAGGLGNYLDALRKKAFIKLDTANNYFINPILIPDPNRQEYKFILQVKKQ